VGFRELETVFDAVDRLAALSDPCPVPGLESLEEMFGADLTGWRTLAGAPRPDMLDARDLDGWTVSNLDRLAEIEVGWVDATAGTALVHFDIRADNVLLAVPARSGSSTGPTPPGARAGSTPCSCCRRSRSRAAPTRPRRWARERLGASG
jgi:hypothetical protein